MDYKITNEKLIKANKIVFKVLGGLSLAMSVLFAVFAIILYRGGGRFEVSLYLAVFNLIAGLMLLQKSR